MPCVRHGLLGRRDQAEQGWHYYEELSIYLSEMVSRLLKMLKLPLCMDLKNPTPTIMKIVMTIVVVMWLLQHDRHGHLH